MLFPPKVLVLGQKARPWESFKLWFKMVKWFPLHYQSQDSSQQDLEYLWWTYGSTTTLSFKIFRNRKHKGVADLMCGMIRDGNWFRSLLKWSWFRCNVHGVASMFIDVLQPLTMLFLIFLRSFMIYMLGISRIIRRLKKSTRGFIGVKDEVEDAFR